MFNNYFKTAFRNLKKFRTFTIVSVLSLAIGTGAFIVLMSYSDIENHYDAFQKDKDQIYRVRILFLERHGSDGLLGNKFFRLCRSYEKRISGN